MASFQDTEGRAWEVAVSVGTIRRVKSGAGVNLMEVVNGELLQQLTGDAALMVDILYWVCKPQADERGLSAADFDGIFDGDVIYDASMALRDAIVNFFPKDKRERAQRMMEKLDKVEAAMWEAAEKEADALLPEDAGKLFTNAPESSE